MKLLTLLSTVLLTSIMGCVTHAPRPATDLSGEKAAGTAPAPQSPPKDPALVEGPTWTMRLELPFMWKVEKPDLEPGVVDPDSDVKRELLARSKEKIDGEQVVIELLTGSIGEHEEVEFIKLLLASQMRNPGIKTLKVAKVKLVSGELAALALQIRMTNGGPRVVIELVTASSGQGYLVQCGGMPDALPKFGALCVETMKTFTLKPAKKQIKPGTPIERSL